MKKNIENIVKHSEVSEKAIEAYLNKRAKESGLLCLKYSNANTTGYPDRLMCLPYGQSVWVELKSKGKKATKLQLIRIEELRSLNHNVFIIDSKADVDTLIDSINEWRKMMDKLSAEQQAKAEEAAIAQYLKVINSLPESEKN